MKRWTIYYLDGTTEAVPWPVLELDKTGTTLTARRAKFEEAEAVFVVANIRKWVPVR